MNPNYYDDKAAGEAATEGMARAAAGVSDEDKAIAREVVEAIANRQQFFTSEDVWVDLTSVAPHINPKKGSFLGWVLKNASNDGIIKLFVGTLPSQRPPNHKRILRVWESQTYSGPRELTLQQRYDRLSAAYNNLKSKYDTLVSVS